MKPDALKVLIYATWRDRLLVFDEPDFPEIELQVPGGTVEAGEDIAAAALREFRKKRESCLRLPSPRWLSMTTVSPRMATTSATGDITSTFRLKVSSPPPGCIAK